jgi:hypothetical protein
MILYQWSSNVVVNKEQVNHSLSVIGEIWCSRLLEVVQVRVEHVEAEETHLSAGHTFGKSSISRVTADHFIVVGLLLFRTTAA